MPVDDMSVTDCKLAQGVGQQELRQLCQHSSRWAQPLVVPGAVSAGQLVSGSSASPHQ